MSLYTLHITKDLEPELLNPRQFMENFTTFALLPSFRGVELPHEAVFNPMNFKTWRSTELFLLKWYNGVVSKAVYFFNEETLTLYPRTPISPIVGYIFITREKFFELTPEIAGTKLTKARKEEGFRQIAKELELYNQYKSGDVWSFEIRKGEKFIYSERGIFGESNCYAKGKALLTHYNQPVA